MLQKGEGRLLNNRYQLLERFGSGGMANVFRARDILLDRYVAIKVLRDDRRRDANFDEQFRHEARAVANLTHPNIVTVYDFGFDNGQPFIVMELVPGTDLKSLLHKRGRFTVDEAIPLIVQACAGIGYAHRAGLVHCDVKPHNMLVTPDNHLKVTDFGIARALATISPGEHTDVVWGSPQYFAPEQAAGHAPSPASDVYSLGVVLYEMLTGTLPFTASTAEELARLHLNADPIPLGEYIPDIPKPLEEIILKVLSKEPSARYRTADQLGRVLMNFGTQRDDPTPSIPISTPRPAATPNYVWEQAPQPAPEADAAPLDIDWLSVGLGLLMVIAVLGLVPFWMWVYFIYITRP
ncbi:MAG: serine/threonine protein kinase [Chloroflexi bacterium]|nr:serine/threonine protein kinase [Chloroflexota bacterium]MBI3339876.1 serine/threonine protein kinase [Chloroflexota bacterium]